MSDETRTVTVESLAAALRKGEPGTQPINMFADPFDDADADDVAAAIFAALPVATTGPEPQWAFIATGLLSTMKGIARDRTVQTITNARKVAEVAIERAEERALRGAAAQADGGEAGLTEAELVAALRDFVALFPADRWPLLRPPTQSTVARLVAP